MTAKEIREALRRGTLDPFDKVSAEGSNIREDLIEVDEIFKEEEGEAESTSTEAKAAPSEVLPTADGAVPVAFPNASASAAAPVASSSASPVQAPSPYKIEIASSAPVAKSQSQSQSTDDEDGPRTNPPPGASAFIPSWRNADTASLTAAKDDKESKSTQKRYYLIDKAKILGPVSALEIQSLFNRGGLNPKVKVQRIGGTKAIPIAQFIASFSEDRIKELTDDGKLNQKVSSPSSKVLNELARAANAQKIAKSRKNKTYIFLALGGFLLGAILLVIFESSQGPKHSSETLEHEGKKGRPKLLQKAQDEDKDDKEVRSRPKAVAAPQRAPKPDPTPAPEVRTPPRRTPSRPAPKATPAPSRPAVVERRSQPEPKKVAVVRPRAPEPTPAPAPVKKESPIERALSSGGGVQTVGPLNFSLTALEACPSKCTLTLRDSSGMSIKAIFFKSAYYDQLKKNPSSIFISGSVRKEGSSATILIQDVR